MNKILEEIQEVLGKVDEKEVILLAEEIMKAKRIFVAGTGRSGLVGKMFAMRLMHCGYDVYVTGETITPSIEADDLLFVISASGTTGTLQKIAEGAKSVGAKIVLVTTDKDSIIGKMSARNVVIPAATKKRLPHEPKTIQPLGSQFAQSAHLLLDALVIYLLENGKEKIDHETLQRRHANLE